MQIRAFIMLFLFAIGFSCRTLTKANLSAEEKPKTKTYNLPIGELQVRVIEQKPLGEIGGDVLFLHGFADRADNHEPLFEEWNRQGLRVISFDYPSHGETKGPDIDKFNLKGGAFPGLAKIAQEVEKKSREDANRPLILAGWSTGGLLGIRILQAPDLSLERKVSAAVFFAPGVAVRPLVGKAGFVTLDTLTQNPNPPHRGPIEPPSPLAHPLFSADLLLNAKLSWKEAYPQSVPTLIVIGDEQKDFYVSPAKIKEWLERQRSGARNIVGLECQGAMHELDNEPDPVGREVRVAATSFAASLGESGELKKRFCQQF